MIFEFEKDQLLEKLRRSFIGIVCSLFLAVFVLTVFTLHKSLDEAFKAQAYTISQLVEQNIEYLSGLDDNLIVSSDVKDLLKDFYLTSNNIKYISYQDHKANVEVFVGNPIHNSFMGTKLWHDHFSLLTKTYEFPINYKGKPQGTIQISLNRTHLLFDLFGNFHLAVGLIGALILYILFFLGYWYHFYFQQKADQLQILSKLIQKGDFRQFIVNDEASPFFKIIAVLNRFLRQISAQYEFCKSWIDELKTFDLDPKSRQSLTQSDLSISKSFRFAQDGFPKPISLSAYPQIGIILFLVMFSELLMLTNLGHFMQRPADTIMIGYCLTLAILAISIFGYFFSLSRCPVQIKVFYWLISLSIIFKLMLGFNLDQKMTDFIYILSLFAAASGFALFIYAIYDLKTEILKETKLHLFWIPVLLVISLVFGFVLSKIVPALVVIFLAVSALLLTLYILISDMQFFLMNFMTKMRGK